MKKYIEITLLPDVDIPLYFLWGKLYTQLHLAFVENKNENNKVTTGVSFPQYDQSKRQIGNKLRVFAQSPKELETLNLSKWFNRLSDYVHITKVRDVPESVKTYAYFRRLTDKKNIEKLARRRANNINVSYEEALHFFQDKDNRKLPKRDLTKYPFISIKSLGSEHKFPLTIALKETDLLDTSNDFSTYGLSSKSSVPLF